MQKANSQKLFIGYLHQNRFSFFFLVPKIGYSTPRIQNHGYSTPHIKIIGYSTPKQFYFFLVPKIGYSTPHTVLPLISPLGAYSFKEVGGWGLIRGGGLFEGGAY